MRTLMRDQPHTYIEYALDYVHAGLLSEAAALLNVYAESGSPDPMISYYHVWIALRSGEKKAARVFILDASCHPAACSFTNWMDDIVRHGSALTLVPEVQRALYQLGTLWSDNGQIKDTVTLW